MPVVSGHVMAIYLNGIVSCHETNFNLMSTEIQAILANPQTRSTAVCDLTQIILLMYLRMERGGTGGGLT